MAPESSDVLVSVVIPCYNGEAFLAAAIDSALAQTHPRIEVIVVDDGSKDGSSAVAEGYSDPRVTLVRQPNTGLSGARNAGIMRSRGEVVTLLDADDVLAPTCVEDRLRTLFSDEAVGIVTGSFVQIDGEGRTFGEIEQTPDRIHTREESWRRPLGPPSGWTIRRRVFERCGLFDPLVRNVEDWEFQLRATIHYRIGSVSALGLYYRQLPNSMSRDSGKVFADARRVYKKNRYYYRAERWAYEFHCQHGVMQVVEMGLRRQLELPKSQALGNIARMVAKYPAIAFYIGMIAARKTINAFRRVAGLKPIGVNH